MKYILYIIVFQFISSFTHSPKILKQVFVNEDSSLREKFIVNILNEYDQKGRWVFVKIVRCKSKFSYEILEPISIFKSFAETNKNLNKKQFISLALVNLKEHNEIFNCPEEIKIYYPKAVYVLKGGKVNMNQYDILKKIPITTFLNTYFTDKKILKERYKKMQNEIIATCYSNNIKVVKLDNGELVYEIFK